MLKEKQEKQKETQNMLRNEKEPIAQSLVGIIIVIRDKNLHIVF